jgi:Tfp pilus assembly protein PilN
MTIKVDLLPTEKKRFGLDPLVIVLFLVVVLATVGLFFYGQKLTRDIQAKRDQIAQVEAQIKEIEAQLPVLEERQMRIKKLEEQIQIIKTLQYDPLRYANLLTQVTMTLPDNVYLESLAIEPGRTAVTMSGKAAEAGGNLPLGTISNLMKNMNDTEYFRDASLSSASRTSIEGGYTGFSFQIEVRYDPQAAATKAPSLPGATAPTPSPSPGGAESAPGATPSP